MVLLLSGFLLVGCRWLQDGPVEPPRVLAEFPLDLNTRWILLPVTFEGQQYRFVLDTGSTGLLSGSLKRGVFEKIRSQSDALEYRSVSAVDPNGIAYRKGLCQNDLLAEVDGRDASGVTLIGLLRSVVQHSKSEIDGAINLAFRRKDTIHRVSFTRSDFMPEEHEAN